MDVINLLPEDFFCNDKVSLILEKVTKRINNFLFPIEIKKYKYFQEYLHFIKLKVIVNILFGCDNLTPSKSINIMWLEHIKNESNYKKLNELFIGFEKFKYLNYNYYNDVSTTIYFYKKFLKLDPLKDAWDISTETNTKLNFSDQIVYY